VEGNSKGWTAMGAKEEYESNKRTTEAKIGKKKWWFKQREPIDRFTGWLVAWTASLFIATCINACILWVTDKTLNDTMINGQRAYVFAKRFNCGFIYKDGVVDHLVFNPTWENTGSTPAYKAKTWTGRSFVYPTQTIDDIEITESNKVPVPSSDIGPHIEVPGTKTEITISDIMTVWRKERRLFLWAYIEYRDVFSSTPQRHTEVSVEVVFREDPSKVLPNTFSDNTLDFLVKGNKFNSAN
jgi:hypothetical protein